MKTLTRAAIFTSVAAASQVMAQSNVPGLEEVVVTAQRTSQNLQDVPVSLTAVSGDALVEQNINELTQLTAAAPSLQVGQDNTFAIRGIGSQISTETTDPSVALAIDGVSLGRNALASLPFLDVAAVEVLNGPQGLLFGKNASAGLINITTKRPVIGETSGAVSGEYLVRDTTPTDAKGTVFTGILNLPVGEKSALRFNVLHSDQDSIIENIYPNTEGDRVELDQERWGIKAKYLYEDGPLSVYLIGDINENNGTGGQFGRTYRTVDPDSGLNDFFAESGIVPGPENLQNDSDGPMWSDVEIGGLSGEVSYELENGIEIVNIAAWRYLERDNRLHGDFSSRVDQILNTNQTEYDQFSNELRFVFPSNDSFSGQAGLFYYQQDSTIDADLEVAGPPPFIAVGFPFCVGAEVEAGPPPACNVSNERFLGSDSVTDFSTESYAIYGQFDFYLTDRLTTTAGARVTYDEVTTDVVQTQINYFVPIGGPRATISESVDNTNLSWKLGAQYDAADSVMVYASIGQGYKAPGFNTDFLGIEEVPFAVQEEVSTTFEAGVKSKLLSDRLVLNVSVFNTDFDDYQAQSFNLNAQGFILQNAATVTSRGAEVAVTALLTDGLTLNWNTAFLDSTFDEFEGASCTPDSQSPDCVDGDFFDASGFPTPLAADITSNLQLQFDRQISDNMEFFAQGNVYYRSDINYGIGSPERELGSVSILNFSSGINMDNGFSFTVFCRNCTDEVVPTSIAFDPGENNDNLASSQQTWGLDSVRSIGLTARYEF